MMGLLAPLLILQVVGAVVFSRIGRGRLEELLATVDWAIVLLIVLTCLLIATFVLILAAMGRFRRARLILD